MNSGIRYTETGLDRIYMDDIVHCHPVRCSSALFRKVLLGRVSCGFVSLLANANIFLTRCIFSKNRFDKCFLEFSSLVQFGDSPWRVKLMMAVFV